jgi:hypothetical protein
MASKQSEVERLVDDEFEDFLDRLYTKVSRKDLDTNEVATALDKRVGDVSEAWVSYVEEDGDG